MAIFTRRRIQAMLNDLAPFLDIKKRSDLVGRLNNKRVEQAIPAEMELALIWAMRDLDCLEIEPEWWVDGKEPDAYVEGLMAGPAMVEIASVSDNSISGENVMDRCSQTIITYANSLKKGFGDHLYFSFAETAELDQGRRLRGIAAPKNYTMSETTKLLIKEWMALNAQPRPRLRIEDGELCVEIEQRQYKQTRHHNYWTPRPPRTYSETNNPIYNALREKLAQVEEAPVGTYRVIFLAETGSRTLNELADTFRNSAERYATAEKIIRRFLRDKEGRVDAIVVFLPQIKHRQFPRSTVRAWKTFIFTNEPNVHLVKGIEQIGANLPLPRFTGSQARSLHRQRAFDHDSKGWYLGTSVTEINNEMTYKISSRALQDFLAGRITEKQFRYFIGEDGTGPSLAFFLNKGWTIQNISIAPGGTDEDDDALVMRFTKDAAAHQFE